MKFVISILTILAAGVSLPGQTLFPLKVATDSTRFKLVSTANGFEIEWANGKNSLLGKRDFGIEITEIKLSNADLNIVCAAPSLKKGFSYSVAMSLTNENSQTVRPKAAEILDSGIEPQTPNLRTITWLDLLETQLEPDQWHTLRLQKILLGTVDCAAPRPEFSEKQRLPYYGAAAGAGVLLGYGLLKNAQINRDYDRYRDLWAAGEPSEVAGKFYNADRKKERNIALGIAGGSLALLAADAFFFSKRLKNVRKRQKTHDEFCGNRGSLGTSEIQLESVWPNAGFVNFSEIDKLRVAPIGIACRFVF